VSARLEGVVSKRIDRPYLPGERGAWLKSKCLNRAEFVVVGWSDPEGSRHLIGSLLLGYYDPEGRLIYAGRVGTGMSVQTLAMLPPAARAFDKLDDASVLTSAKEEPVWRPTGAVQGALGATGTRRRDHLSWLD
jgi:bifunctional non-homologous end joining protein LigD